MAELGHNQTRAPQQTVDAEGARHTFFTDSPQ
jgi:hypothetical protein